MENDIQVVTEQPKELNLGRARRLNNLEWLRCYGTAVTGMLAPAGEYFANHPELTNAAPEFHAIAAKLMECRAILAEFETRLEVMIFEATKT